MAIRLEDLLASFRRHLRAAAKAPRTIELYSQSVQYLTRWLADRGRPATLDELTRHAIAAWLAELAEPSTVGTRLLRLLLDTGVWVAELCGLALTDVLPDRELTYVTGKGSRARVVPFGARTAQAVDRYLPACHDLPPVGHEQVFYGHHPAQQTVGISTRWVSGPATALQLVVRCGAGHPVTPAGRVRGV